jgi:hypothetical protein
LIATIDLVRDPWTNRVNTDDFELLEPRVGREIGSDWAQGHINIVNHSPGGWTGHRLEWWVNVDIDEGVEHLDLLGDKDVLLHEKTGLALLWAMFGGAPGHRLEDAAMADCECPEEGESVCKPPKCKPELAGL